MNQVDSEYNSEGEENNSSQLSGGEEPEKDSDQEYEEWRQRFLDDLFDEDYLRYKSCASIFLFSILCMNSFVTIGVSLYDYVQKQPASSTHKSSSAGRKKKRKSAVDESIYAKYKDWKPKEPSYFEMLKQREERLEATGFDFESEGNRLYSVKMNQSRFEYGSEISLHQVALGLLIAGGSLYIAIKLFKKLESSIGQQGNNFEVNRTNRYYQQLIVQRQDQLREDFDTNLFHVNPLSCISQSILDYLKGKTCLICQLELVKSDVTILLSHNVTDTNLELAHSFHSSCLFNWMSHCLKEKIMRMGSQSNEIYRYYNHHIDQVNQNYNCPTCRAQIDFNKERIGKHILAEK